MTALLAALLIGSSIISPSDSVRSMITVASVPERALLFAELAARMEGGEAAATLGSLLELAGEFSDARRQYRLLLASQPGPQLRNWLTDRSRGSSAMDTSVVITASVENTGNDTARALEISMPLPHSHPPFQRLRITETDMRRAGEVLTAMIDRLPPGETRRFRVTMSVRQVPGSYRPLPDSLGMVSLEQLLREAEAAVEAAEGERGLGPCLTMSLELRSRMAGRLELSVVGGLVRRGDSLVFHAWNLLDQGPLAGMPVDPLLLSQDSLRGIGHCPTDLIPLWDLLATGGSELSVVCPARERSLRLTMEAELR